MTLSTEEIALIQFSFVEIVKDERWAAVLFYERLFEIAPQLRPLFLNGISAQTHNPIQFLAKLVNHAGELDVMLPELQALGRRHMMYGVQMDDFRLAGKALIWTIRQTLGNRYTDEIENAWRALYAIVVGSVLAGAVTPQRASNIPYMRDS